MNVLADTWTAGTVIGLPIAAVVALLFIAAAVVFFFLASQEDRSGYSDRGLFIGSGIGSVLCVLATVVITVLAFYPFQSEYHRWHTTSGTVTAISSRLIGADKSTTQRFVVDLAGVGLRSCDDTRCAAISKGDYLTLACKRSWQWSGTDGYDCNFVSVRGAK